jgi:hypothetical protein
MTLDNTLAESLLHTYAEAWTTQNTPKILSIFTEDGIYHERVLKEPMRGHSEIAAYWDSKVCTEQSHIQFKLLTYYIIEQTLIAEWEAWFHNNTDQVHVHMKEVAIMEIKDDKIASLREYWQSEKSPL